MPEDNEIQEQPQELVEGVLPQEEEPEKHVPYSRFEKVNSDKHRLADQLHQTQLLLLQTQQNYLANQQQGRAQSQPVDEEIDPEIERILAPVIEKRTRGLVNRVQQQDAFINQIAAKEEGNRAWDYVEANVPDMDELKPHILEYLDGLPPELAHQYTSDPRNVILVANLVRANKAAGITMNTKNSNTALKQRAKSESGGSTRSGASDHNVQWSTLSGADLEAAQRKLGIKPISEW
jgi:vacuolar-type H+-ATPase subunit I/STV1